MKRILPAIAAALMLLAATDASAVTQKEMEQARAATARIFLRNANNGADYLDNINATTMAELEGKLHQREKDNLKTFNSVAMPRDYAGWDKEKLVTYWSETFYSQPAISGVIKSLGFAKKQTKMQLSKMSVSAPSENPAGTAADAATEPDQQPATGIEQPFADADDPVAAKQDEEARLQATADSIAALQAEGAEQAANDSGGDGSTWIYVGVLCVLVALVVALIIYATRTSKKNNKPARDDDDDDSTDPEEERESRRESMHDSRMEEELRSLTAENAELRRAVEDYKFHLNSLKAELEAEKRRVTMLRTERAAANAQSAERERVQTEPAAAAPRVKGTPERLRRNIFLGRANRDGIFLRAEREVNLDQSLFRLVSNDGVTGTFTVIEEPEVEARIMADPDGTLAYSCILTDRDTFGRESVVTERPGTAVFESGRWRVLRKAQVKLV